MHQVAHQTLAILGERPGVESASDQERRRVDVGGVPQRAAGRLIERVLEHAVGRAQARRVAHVAGRIARHAFLPELGRNGGIAGIVLVFDWYLAVPARRFCGFWWGAGEAPARADVLPP